MVLKRSSTPPNIVLPPVQPPTQTVEQAAKQTVEQAADTDRYVGHMKIDGTFVPYRSGDRK